MSYILEALKKAQAERQLGNAPTIHAPQPVQVSTAAGGAAAQRKPLLVGLGAGALVVLLGAAVMWRHAAAPEAQKPAQAAQPSATPGAAAAALAVRAPDLPPPAPRVVEPRVVEPRAVPVAPAPAPMQAGDARVASAANPPPAAARPAQPDAMAQNAARQAPAPLPTPVPASPSAPAPEDSLPLVQQLPETIRSQIPRVAFGGYMYSPNPADRLVLVDNVLRHEGEEVAPGLVLEKLMPKAAVMNFRGVRYRVAY